MEIGESVTVVGERDDGGDSQINIARIEESREQTATHEQSNHQDRHVETPGHTTYPQ